MMQSLLAVSHMNKQLTFGAISQLNHVPFLCTQLLVEHSKITAIFRHSLTYTITASLKAAVTSELQHCHHPCRQQDKSPHPFRLAVTTRVRRRG